MNNDSMRKMLTTPPKRYAEKLRRIGEHGAIAKRRKRKQEEALRPDKPFTNKDDKDAIELIEWLRNYAANKSGGTLDTFVEMFAELDEDSNKMIDFPEFKRKLKAFGGYNRAPTKMFKRAYDIIDTDRDGELNINEMRYAIVGNDM